MDGFSKNILDMIENFSYDLFVIQQDFRVDCTCINPATKEPDPNCSRCLGTGHKIKIKKIRGAGLDTGSPATVREAGNWLIAKNFYIDHKYDIENENLIVDDEEVYAVYQAQVKQGFGGERVYTKCMAILKKLDSELFLSNFKKIIGR